MCDTGFKLLKMVYEIVWQGRTSKMLENTEGASFPKFAYLAD